MPSQCHSVVRTQAVRATRLDACGVLSATGCDYAVSRGYTEIALTKVFQERQEALLLNGNGDICVDKPKAQILRWYQAAITFCNVDPEFFNIVSAEPLIVNDAVTPEAVGWCSLPDSPAASSFALEFWSGTEQDEECADANYGYGLLPRMHQAVIGDVTFGNNVITFTVTGITKAPNLWGVGPYNVINNLSGPNAGFPGKRLVAADTTAHKCFQWTTLAPPPAACGCQDLTPLLTVAPLAGVAPLAVNLTVPTGIDGNPMLPGVIDWGDGSPLQAVAAGTTIPHNYALAGNYVPIYRSTAYSAPDYVSAPVVVS